MIILDSPTNFADLKGVYEAELRNTADEIWTQLNTNAPQRTSQIAPRLSPDQLDELNTRGELTIIEICAVIEPSGELAPYELA